MHGKWECIVFCFLENLNSIQMLCPLRLLLTHRACYWAIWEDGTAVLLVKFINPVAASIDFPLPIWLRQYDWSFYLSLILLLYCMLVCFVLSHTYCFFLFHVWPDKFLILVVIFTLLWLQLNISFLTETILVSLTSSAIHAFYSCCLSCCLINRRPVKNAVKLGLVL